MGKFILEIDLDNEGMKNPTQLAEALIEVATRISRYDYDLDHELVRGIMDENGNHVGSWKIDPESHSQ